jgi:hypothetical protein
MNPNATPVKEKKVKEVKEVKEVKQTEEVKTEAQIEKEYIMAFEQALSSIAALQHLAAETTKSFEASLIQLITTRNCKQIPDGACRKDKRQFEVNRKLANQKAKRILHEYFKKVGDLMKELPLNHSGIQKTAQDKVDVIVGGVQEYIVKTIATKKIEEAKEEAAAKEVAKKKKAEKPVEPTNSTKKTASKIVKNSKTKKKQEETSKI